MKKATQLYLGIDPGKTGGIALIDHTGRALAAHAMPKTFSDVVLLLKELHAGDLTPRCLIEFVHAFPKMGVVSAFTFGKGAGVLEGALLALDVPFEPVQPRRWQQALGCLSGGDKNITKARAQALFPKLAITHLTADALLIAEYGRRLHAGAIPPTKGQPR